MERRPLAFGDSFLLEQQFASVPASEVAKQFGEKFAAKLSELSRGHWQGPVESGYGVHLVLVSERTERAPDYLASPLCCPSRVGERSAAQRQ